MSAAPTRVGLTQALGPIFDFASKDMSPQILRIEIETSDKSLFHDLKDKNFEGVRLMTKAFICDSPDWIPPVENVLQLVIEISVAVETNLIAAWLYDRFKDRKPEILTVNDVAVQPENVVIVINNYTTNVQIIKNEKH